MKCSFLGERPKTKLKVWTLYVSQAFPYTKRKTLGSTLLSKKQAFEKNNGVTKKSGKKWGDVKHSRGARE